MLKKTLTAIMIILSANSVAGQNPTDPYEGFAEEIYMDFEFEQNLATPIVGDQERGEIRKYVSNFAEKHKGGKTIDLMRNGEVMVVTLPSDNLFLPNDTLLSSYASRLLDPVTAMATDPKMWKIVYTVHTDDTGSSSYLDKLSTARLNSIYDWLLDAVDKGKLDEATIIIPYSMAATDPLNENDTRQHRYENRRVEFYFIPGPKMIELGRKNLLNTK